MAFRQPPWLLQGVQAPDGVLNEKDRSPSGDQASRAIRTAALTMGTSRLLTASECVHGNR